MNVQNKSLPSNNPEGSKLTNLQGDAGVVVKIHDEKTDNFERRTAIADRLAGTVHKKLSGVVFTCPAKLLTEFEALLTTLNLTVGIRARRVAEEEFIRSKIFRQRCDEMNNDHKLAKAKFLKHFKRRIA